MTALETHTPLETLLLFQSLDPSVSDPPSFTRISDSLKNNDLIRESESYNPTRLDPEALTQLYLRLMKEEARAEVIGIDKGVNDVEEQQQPPTRKKPLSPLLNTVNDASRHSHLLPSLLNRLYFRYRNHAIKAIEGEEYRYRLLQRDIQEINCGEWDARLQLEEATSKKDSGKDGVNSIQTLLRQDSDVEKSNSESAQHPAKSPQRQDEPVVTPPNQQAVTSSDLPTVPAGVSLDTQHEKLEHGKQRAPNVIHEQPQAKDSVEGPQSTELSTQSPARPTQESQQLPISQDKQQPQSMSSEKNIPFLPPRQPTNPGYPLPSPDVGRRMPYPLSESPASSAPSPSPRLQQSHLPTHDRSSQSPITLPPLAGMLRSSGSPLASLDNLADISPQQQFRPNPPLPSPRSVQLPVGQGHPIQLPQPRNYPMQVFPYYDSQQPYGVPYPYGHGHIPPYHHAGQGGMPPYQGPVPSPGRGSIYGSGPVYQSPPPSYSQYPAYSQTPSYHQTPVQTPFNRSQAPRFSEQSTPVSSARRRPPRPSPIDTSTTSTKWKNVETPGSMRSPGSPLRPRPEEISPLSEKAPSPVLGILPSQNKQPIGQANKKARASSSRTMTSRSQGPRAASAASSTAAGSAPTHTRSQSLLSHADELSLDNTSQIHKIKPEPPATPAGDDDVSVTETTADENFRKSTRRRRETLRGLEMTEINRTGTKRKRGPLETRLRSSPPYHSNFNNNRSNHVLGTRNFPRTSATIMNDITAHKLASMFSKPITDREAPGYKDLIFRPQDLKSIKSAIVAGSKALVSTADNAGAPSASGEVGSPAAQAASGIPSVKSASVWIPEAADVLPPKGIVNSAQLEKELMRMFANAIMFNPDPKRGFGSAFREGHGRHGSASERRGEEQGEDGDTGDRMKDEDDEAEGSVVEDTREMFEAVERGVADWRAAERAVEDFGSGAAPGATSAMKGPLARLRGGDKEEDGEVDELAGEDVHGRDDEDLGGGKRRRR